MYNLSLADLQSRVNSFLSDDHSHVLSISGAWGVGKTFAWKSEFKKFQENNTDNKWCKTYTYVSLFGINDIKSLKSKIVFSGSSEESAEGIGGFLTKFFSPTSKIVSSLTLKTDEQNMALSGVVGALGGFASIGTDMYRTHLTKMF